MAYYQFLNKNAYLIDKKHIKRHKELVTDYLSTLAAVFATVLEIEAPIQTKCLFLVFDNDFFFSPIKHAFRRRPVAKNHEDFYNPAPFNTKIVEGKITVAEEEFKRWLVEVQKKITAVC